MMFVNNFINKIYLINITIQFALFTMNSILMKH